ncbi:hypothetical protein TeGR_g7681, partial [Tetraparma gracilis]
MHKQAAAGDCDKPEPKNESKADKGKWTAWKGKSGLSQHEAMSRYISECDRQIRVYGSLAGPSTTTVENTSSQPTMTPLPTPNPQQAQSSSAGLSGIESVPLLAAAASESQASYMQRLSLSSPSSAGFWSRQIPLFAAGGSKGFAAGAEGLLISAGRLLEAGTRGAGAGPLSPSSFHAMSYPLHVVLLTHWILLIYLLSSFSTLFLTAKTLLLGSAATGFTAASINSSVIAPTAATASSLMTAPSNSLPVRSLGLLLTPLTVASDVSAAAAATAGAVAGAAAHAALLAASWWYFLLVLPWAAAAATWAAAGYGVCLGVI